MDKKIILAKAGSGKTYHICNELDPNKRNLLIAYTNRNISNLISEISNAHQNIPEYTEVITFHSFIYRNFIRPFELLVSDQFKCPPFRSKGVSLIKPEKPIKNGKYNPNYIRNTHIRHYYTENCKEVYLSRMSDLILKNKDILRHGISYLKKFFDYIYIDEVQDFRESDWKLLEHIIKSLDNVVLVGDFFQHSVSGDNNSGPPFKKENTIEKYKTYLNKLGLTVDEHKLSKSRRCAKEICTFVTAKTDIQIESNDETKTGIVKEITDREELIKMLKDDSIMKLLNVNSHKQYFRAVNWGVSKGDTYDNILVVLTDVLNNIFSEDFKVKGEITRNRLYVVLTRTKGNLFIVKNELFKKFEGKQI